MNNLFNTALLLTLILALAVSAAFAQATRTVAGEVVDSTGAVIVNATVNLVNDSNGSSKTVQSDEKGRFSIDGVVRGAYTIFVNAEGFSAVSRDIKISESGVAPLKIEMAVGNIAEEVSVTATRTQVSAEDTAVSVSVVDRARLEEKPVNTIGDVFRDLPGTETVNEGSFQVRPRIRGFDSNRVLILVDGERLNNGRTATQQSGIEIGLVDTDQVESVEVVRGAGSVLYGTDALGGTVNLITKGVQRNRDGGFRFSAAFNGFYSTNDHGRRGSVALTGSGNRFAFRVAQTLERYGNYFTGDLNGSVIDGVNADGEVLNGQSHGSNTQVTTRFFLDDNNDLKLSYERRRAGNIGVPTLVGFFNAWFPFSDRDKFNAKYEVRNVSRYLSKVTSSFYVQQQKRNFSNILDIPAFPPFFPGLYQISETATDTNTVGFDVQTNWLTGNDNLLIAGVSGFRDHNSDERTVELQVPVSVIDTTKSVPDASFGSFAAFAQDTYDINGRIRIIGGIRVERFFSKAKPTEGFSLPGALTPSQIEDLGLTGLTDGLNITQTASTGDIGTVIKISNELSFTARVGRSFRVPNLFERFFTDLGSVEGFVVGNPNLKPESGINVDTGLKFRTSKFAGSATYFRGSFRNFLSNEIARDRNGDPIVIQNGPSSLDVYQTVNLDKVRVQGFEADIEVPLALGFGFLTPGGNVSYLRGDNLTSGEPLNTITPFKAVLNIRWENLQSNYFVDWSTRTVFKQDRLSQEFLEVNGGPEPGFTVSDLRGGYIFKKDRYKFSFNAGITNLFGRQYSEQFVLAPARGRSFVFGTRWEIN